MATIESEPRVVDVTSGGVINAVLNFLRTNMVCTLDTYISTVESGQSIKSPTGGGLPTDIGKFIFDMKFVPDCHLWGVVWQPFPQMERIFPLRVELTIAGVMHPLDVMESGWSNYDFTSKIMDLIRNGTINANTKSIEIVVKYPVKKTYNVLKPSIFSYEYKEDTATVPVDISLPTPECTVDTTKTCDDGSVITTHRCIAGKLVPTGTICPVTPPSGPITCTQSISSLTTPANIPFKMPDPADLTSPPTLDLSKFDIGAFMTGSCVPTGPPAKLFPMDMNLTIDDGISSVTGLVTVAGAGSFTADIVGMMKELMLKRTRAELVKLSDVKLILMYPGKVEFADANAVGVKTETKKVEKRVPIKMPVPPTPGGCTEDTTFTCPDGTVITTGICNTATGVLTPTGNVCPPPGGCTEDTTFTCPDGTVITTGICNIATGVITPTGNVCPVPPGLPIICTPSISSLTTPAIIPFKMPDPADLTSPPTLDLSKFDIAATISVPCVPAGTPAKLFPMDLDLIIDDGIAHYAGIDIAPYTGLVRVERAGIFTVDIVGIIRNWMLTKTRAELVTLSSINLVLNYPGKVEFADANAPGIWSEMTSTTPKWVSTSIPTPGGCTKDTTFTCPDGTVITTEICNTATGVLTPTGNVCPPPIGCAEETVKDPFTCPDGSRIYLKKCVTGVWVDSGQKCPEATPPGPAARKSVYTTTPLLTRVGKRIPIVGLVFCGTEKVGGEKAWISIDGELLTTANTRNGEVTAEWTPVVPGLYTICVTVPASRACNAYASGCTMMQVVAELSKEEIEAAEEEFERAKERIGEIMERI